MGHMAIGGLAAATFFRSIITADAAAITILITIAGDTVIAAAIMVGAGVMAMDITGAAAAAGTVTAMMAIGAEETGAAAMAAKVEDRAGAQHRRRRARLALRRRKPGLRRRNAHKEKFRAPATDDASTKSNSTHQPEINLQARLAAVHHAPL